MSRTDLPGIAALLVALGCLLEGLFVQSLPALFYMAGGVILMQGVYRICTGVWFNPETDRYGVVKRHRPISAAETPTADPRR